MNNLDREVGEINERLKNLCEDFREMKKDVRALLDDKMKRYGASGVIALAVSAISHLAVFMWGHK